MPKQKAAENETKDDTFIFVLLFLTDRKATAVASCTVCSAADLLFFSSVVAVPHPEQPPLKPRKVVLAESYTICSAADVLILSPFSLLVWMCRNRNT